MQKKHINSYDIVLNMLKLKGNDGVEYGDYLEVVNKIRYTYCNSTILNNYYFSLGNFSNKGNTYVFKTIGIGQDRKFMIKDDEKSIETFNKYDGDTNLFLIINDYYKNKGKNIEKGSRKFIDPNMGKDSEEVFSAIFTKKR